MCHFKTSPEKQIAELSPAPALSQQGTPRQAQPGSLIIISKTFCNELWPQERKGARVQKAISELSMYLVLNAVAKPLGVGPTWADTV